jgi:diguanylate cyclase (GGDEF)-like protein
MMPMTDSDPKRRRGLFSIRLDPLRALRARSSADEALPESAIVDPPLRAEYRWRYTVAGVLLALGAPLGALLLRTTMADRSPSGELTANMFFYVYTLIGTSIVFGAAGFVAGTITDALARERDRFHELSEQDELTGLLNSRAFWERYRRAVEKAGRFHEPLSLLVIDVDHLKKINDQEGHRFGNEVLEHVARSIRTAKRNDDIAARWGGDEFVVLMPGAGSDAAARVAESLLGLVRSQPVRSNRSERNVGITVGIACAASEQSATGLFDRADMALYVGKRRGGDQYQVDTGC